MRAQLLKRSAAAVLTLAAALFSVLVLAVLSGPAHAAPDVPFAALQHQGPLRREAQRVWGLDAPVATFAAQLHQESRWNPSARSPVGASGLAQFMPSTAAWISTLDGELASTAPTNPRWAIRALVVYDLWLYQRIRLGNNQAPGAGCQRMAYTLASYNGGLGWTYKRQALSQRPDVCLGDTCTINPGITAAAQRENEHYPRAIFAIEPAYTRWGLGSCV